LIVSRSFSLGVVRASYAPDYVSDRSQIDSLVSVPQRRPLERAGCLAEDRTIHRRPPAMRSLAASSRSTKFSGAFSGRRPQLDSAVLVKVGGELGEVDVQMDCLALARQRVHPSGRHEIGQRVGDPSPHHDYLRVGTGVLCDLHDDTQLAVAAERSEANEVPGQSAATHVKGRSAASRKAAPAICRAPRGTRGVATDRRP